jgi:hypothetical protein
MYKSLRLTTIFLMTLIVDFATVAIFNCQKKNPSEPFYNPTNQIALYLDAGVWDDCMTSTKSLLDAMKYDYTIVTIDSI